MDFTFNLSDTETKTFQDWIEKQYKANFYAGCNGGLITYIITNTTLGTVFKCRNNVTLEEIDITDYSVW